MKGQWNLLLALVFALIIAIFSVLNVEQVPVNFLFQQTSLPLIIVILASTLIGGLIVGSVGLLRQYKLQREVKLLRKKLESNMGDEALEEVDQTLDEEQYLTTKQKGAEKEANHEEIPDKTNISSVDEEVDDIRDVDQANGKEQTRNKD